MLSLRSIIEEALAEQEDEGNVIEFPQDNFNLSIFRSQRKLLFTPQFHNAMTKNVRTLVTMLKQNFRIKEVNDKSLGAFEIEVEPTEDFESVVDFIKQQNEKTM
jgi:hypothetical protein